MDTSFLPLYFLAFAVLLLIAGSAYSLARGGSDSIWGTLTRPLRRKSSNARTILNGLVSRVGGKVDPGELTLRFDRIGFPAQLALRPRDRLNTEIAFNLGGEGGGWLAVSSQGMLQALLEQFGIRDLQSGDKEFDDAFEVRAHEPAWGRKWLQPELRRILLQMDRRFDVLMRITPEQLVLRARLDIIDHRDVETFLGLAFQALDLLELEPPTAVVVASVREVLDSETRCQVCGTPLSRGRLVRCAKCRAAHHADCWQFNGLCATFACGGREKKAA